MQRINGSFTGADFFPSGWGRSNTVGRYLVPNNLSANTRGKWRRSIVWFHTLIYIDLRPAGHYGHDRVQCWRRDEIFIDNQDLVATGNSFNRLVRLNSPKATVTFFPLDAWRVPEVAFSFGKSVFTEDPRTGSNTKHIDLDKGLQFGLGAGSHTAWACRTRSFDCSFHGRFWRGRSTLAFTYEFGR